MVFINKVIQKANLKTINITNKEKLPNSMTSIIT